MIQRRKDSTSGDIDAMFDQVAVPLEDQVALCLLWRQSPESESYKHLRRIFGAKPRCAPTCLNYALLRAAEDNENRFPAALAVKRNFYMNITISSSR